MSQHLRRLRVLSPLGVQQRRERDDRVELEAVRGFEPAAKLQALDHTLAQDLGTDACLLGHGCVDGAVVFDQRTVTVSLELEHLVTADSQHRVSLPANRPEISLPRVSHHAMRPCSNPVGRCM